MASPVGVDGALRVVNAISAFNLAGAAFPEHEVLTSSNRSAFQGHLRPFQCQASRHESPLDEGLLQYSEAFVPRRSKDGKQHTYWSLVETVRTSDGPRQRRFCYLGELNGNAQARWLKTIEVFNEHGESRQLKRFPSQVEPPPNDPNPKCHSILSGARRQTNRKRRPMAAFTGIVDRAVMS
jgi:hypothetical protein